MVFGFGPPYMCMMSTTTQQFDHIHPLYTRRYRLMISHSPTSHLEPQSLEKDVHPKLAKVRSQFYISSRGLVFLSPNYWNGHMMMALNISSLEHTVMAYQLQKSNWAFHLVPLLTGRARGTVLQLWVQYSPPEPASWCVLTAPSISVPLLYCSITKIIKAENKRSLPKTSPELRSRPSTREI